MSLAWRLRTGVRFGNADTVAAHRLLEYTHRMFQWSIPEHSVGNDAWRICSRRSRRQRLARKPMWRMRSVAVEHVAWEALRQVGLDTKLKELCFTGSQRAAAIATLVARIVAPARERATRQWLQQQSALGELIDYGFATMDHRALYRIADLLETV